VSDTSHTPPSSPEAGVAPAPPAPRHWWRHWKLILTGLVAAPVLAFALFTFLALNWSYSEGQRAGTLQKFSHKGWLCKTWEGELMQPTAPGVAPTVWMFSVRDDAVARRVNLGLGKHVVLFYKEHRGVPTSCFGDTPYYVDGIRLER
jgi:hypothetical protein